MTMQPESEVESVYETLHVVRKDGQGIDIPYSVPVDLDLLIGELTTLRDMTITQGNGLPDSVTPS